jgi:hypothetical protein
VGPTGPQGPPGQGNHSILGGDGQLGLPGQELPEPLIIQVAGLDGTPLPGFVVNFRVVQGGGSVWGGVAVTNHQGIAQDYWTLGPDPGEQVVEVRSAYSVANLEGKFVIGRFTSELLDYSGVFTHQRVTGPIVDFDRLTVVHSGRSISFTPPTSPPQYLPGTMTGTIEDDGTFSARWFGAPVTFEITGTFTGPDSFTARMRMWAGSSLWAEWNVNAQRLP